MYKMKFICVLIVYFVLTSIVTKGIPNNDIIVFSDDDSVSPRKNQKLIQNDNGQATLEYKSFFNFPKKCPVKHVKVGTFCFPE